MKAESNRARGMANRLRVFAAIRKHMDLHEDPPTGAEIAAATNLAVTVAHRHMHALVGAKGLDGFRTRTPRQVSDADSYREKRQRGAAHQAAVQYRHYEDLPVDEAMALGATDLSGWSDE